MSDEVTPKRYSRSFIDNILGCFHKACDEADLETAKSILCIVEHILARRPIQVTRDRRKHMEALVAAHERLWVLRQEAAEMERIGLRVAA